MDIFVSITDANGKKQTFKLRSQPIIIGRAKSSHVVIKDDLASSQHMCIWHEDECVYIEDYKSKNGVYLNGVKVFKQRIYVKDKIKIGYSTLTLDEKKMNSETIKALTSTDSTRVGGEVTLQIETHKEKSKRIKNAYKKNTSVAKSKLYEGAGSNKNVSDGLSGKSLVIKEYSAWVIDLFLSVLTIGIPYFILKVLYPEEFVKYINPELGHNAYITGDALYITGASILMSFIFYKWNRGRKKGSIGEKLLGLD